MVVSVMSSPCCPGGYLPPDDLHQVRAERRARPACGPGRGGPVAVWHAVGPRRRRAGADRDAPGRDRSDPCHDGGGQAGDGTESHSRRAWDGGDQPPAPMWAGVRFPAPPSGRSGGEWSPGGGREPAHPAGPGPPDPVGAGGGGVIPAGSVAFRLSWSRPGPVALRRWPGIRSWRGWRSSP